MRRVIHLSDLHFGRARPELLDPLIAKVNEIAPDLVAISGDLTQRARVSQYQDARAFIDRLDPPCLIVPGNHDTPLDNLLVRLFRPWGRYRRWIDADLEPSFHDDEIAVVGVNTVNPLVWQRGWIAGHATRRVCAAFSDVSAAVHTRIVVVHHPLEHAPGERKSLMRGAGAAIDAFAECGADIVLSGHLHSWRAEPYAERKGRTQTLQIHAGTGLSTRLRGEENDFNLLTLEKDRIVVERYVAGEDATGFVPAARLTFRSGTGGWASWLPEGKDPA